MVAVVAAAQPTRFPPGWRVVGEKEADDFSQDREETMRRGLHHSAHRHGLLFQFFRLD